MYWCTCLASPRSALSPARSTLQPNSSVVPRRTANTTSPRISLWKGQQLANAFMVFREAMQRSRNSSLPPPPLSPLTTLCRMRSRPMWTNRLKLSPSLSCSVLDSLLRSQQDSTRFKHSYRIYSRVGEIFKEGESLSDNIYSIALPYNQWGD